MKIRVKSWCDACSDFHHMDIAADMEQISILSEQSPILVSASCGRYTCLRCNESGYIVLQIESEGITSNGVTCDECLVEEF